MVYTKPGSLTERHFRNRKVRKYLGPNYKRNKITYYQIGQKVLRDVNMLKNLINVEFKVLNHVTTSTAVPNTGTVMLLNHLALGDDYNSRSGRQVRWKSLQWRCTTNKHASASSSRVRMLFVIDKQCKQALPSASEILDSSVAPLIDGFRQLDARKRFVILKDLTFLLNTDRPEITRTGYFKMDMKTVYDASDNGDITDIYSNSLYMVMIGDEATNQPTHETNVRLRYIDN